MHRMGARPGVGEQAEQMSQGFGPQPLAGLHAAVGQGQILPVECERHLLHDLPVAERACSIQAGPINDPNSDTPSAGKAANVSFNVSGSKRIKAKGSVKHAPFLPPTRSLLLFHVVHDSLADVVGVDAYRLANCRQRERVDTVLCPSEEAPVTAVN